MAVKYELVTQPRGGKGRARDFVSEDDLAPGQILILGGRHWLVERVDAGADGGLARALAKPARYRIVLVHPDGRQEPGAFRRHRPGAPRLGHAFTTVEDGDIISWQVVDERLAQDEAGEPYLELVAERDYSEVEELPSHELEHALEAREEEVPEGAIAAMTRAEESGLELELAALEAGEVPEWSEAEAYIDALILEEIEDDLLEMCGVDPDSDPRERWLDTVKSRLRSDLERFREDIETDHGEIEEWDFRGGRVFASVGTDQDEFDLDKGHGWMSRLVDSGVLQAAGFERVRKAEL